MVKLRQSQLDGMHQKLRQEYENRVLSHIEEAFPEEVWNLPKDVKQLRIRESIDRALNYGLETEEDVAAFVDWTFELGETFDRNAWASEILLDPTLSGQDKVIEIETAVNELEESDDLDLLGDGAENQAETEKLLN